MEADERYSWGSLARAQTIQPYILALIEETFRYPTPNLSTFERYIATVNLTPMQCPYCDQSCSYFEAVRDADYKLGHGAKELRCVHCNQELVELVPLIGAPRWGKKATDADAERLADAEAPTEPEHPTVPER